MHWIFYVLGALALAAAAVVGWYAYNPPYEDESEYDFPGTDELLDGPDTGPQSEDYEFVGPSEAEVAAQENEDQ